MEFATAPTPRLSNSSKSPTEQTYYSREAHANSAKPSGCLLHTTQEVTKHNSHDTSRRGITSEVSHTERDDGRNHGPILCFPLFPLSYSFRRGCYLESSGVCCRMFNSNTTTWSYIILKKTEGLCMSVLRKRWVGG